MLKEKAPIIIAGGGAAGFFAAIRCAEQQQERPVILLEKSRHLLSKVKVSGGGRCNVTHACFDVQELIKNYPRGASELIAPFHRFNPAHTIEWFEQRGVKLKTEADGRMFPVTDSSQTIVNCLLNAAEKSGVSIITNSGITDLIPPANNQDNWQVIDSGNKNWKAHQVMIATGSSNTMWNLLKKMGHHLEVPVPSLFTLNLAKNNLLSDLPGITVSDVSVKIGGTKITTTGNLLVTHWGISGPAVLRLSAWGAKTLYDLNYRTPIEINWINPLGSTETLEKLNIHKKEFSKQLVSANSLFNLPQRLWKRITEMAQIPETLRWADMSNKLMDALTKQLTQTTLFMTGKSTFKDEFVTCGGIRLNEVNFKTMESKLFNRLYFAGEVLNIDAITGGFNFQAAWTCGWIAGNSMAEN